MSPKFKHDCGGCNFHKTVKYNHVDVDFYTCGKSGCRSVIIRFSNSVSDYISGELFECVTLSRVDKFALCHGLELNDAEKSRLLKLLLREDKCRWSREDYKFMPVTKQDLVGDVDWFDCFEFLE